MTSPGADWSVAAGDDEPGGARRGAGTVRPGGVSWQQPQAKSAVRASPGGLQPGPAVNVLADRLAAALVHHEPGWRLPRHSALARRYNVSPVEIDAAVDELISRHLLRRLADGQVYRASPAEYSIGLEGVPGLLSRVDAMGGEFACRNRQIAWRAPPEDISWALQMPAGEQACVVRYLWAAGGEPAALCTTYLPGHMARAPSAADSDRPASADPGLPAALNLVRLTEQDADCLTSGGATVAGSPASLHIEVQAPPPSVARSLRLTVGQPAMMVTVRFDDTHARPVALTVAVLRPDMFRVVLETPQPPLPDGDVGTLSGAWTHAVEDVDG